MDRYKTGTKFTTVAGSTDSSSCGLWALDDTGQIHLMQSDDKLGYGTFRGGNNERTLADINNKGIKATDIVMYNNLHIISDDKRLFTAGEYRSDGPYASGVAPTNESVGEHVLPVTHHLTVLTRRSQANHIVVVMERN